MCPQITAGIPATAQIQLQPFAHKLDAFLDTSAVLVILVTYSVRTSVRLQVVLGQQLGSDNASDVLSGVWISSAINLLFIAALVVIPLAAGLRALRAWWIARRCRVYVPV